MSDLFSHDAPPEGALEYVPSPGGWKITRYDPPEFPAGSLRGITLPETIDGLPVEELEVLWQGDLGFIHGPALKRAVVRFESPEKNQPCSCYLRLSGPIETLVLYAKCPLRLSCQSESLLFLRVHARDTAVGEDGFRGCPELQLARFSGLIRTDPNRDGSALSHGIFQNLQHLTSVYGVLHGERSGDHVFDGCASLTHAPELAVTYIGDYAFRNCLALKNVHYRKPPVEIGSYAFSGCTALEQFFIPNSVLWLGSYAFAGCRSLSAIHFPEAISEIPSHCFCDCSALRKVYLSDRITVIGSYAFSGCTQLSSPWIPNALESIDTRAFYGVRFPWPVNIPPTVHHLGHQALGTNLQTVIRGVPGSAAERYASENHLRFIPADSIL